MSGGGDVDPAALGVLFGALFGTSGFIVVMVKSVQSTIGFRQLIQTLQAEHVLLYAEMVAIRLDRDKCDRSLAEVRHEYARLESRLAQLERMNGGG